MTDGSSAVTATTTIYSSDQHASFSNPVAHSGSITTATNFSALVRRELSRGQTPGQWFFRRRRMELEH
jgi:hypothetical protein